MLDEIKQQVEMSLAPLVGGILKDSEKLIRQEIALAKAEFREDFGRLKVTVAYVVLGVAFTMSAAILLLFSLVHGLASAFPDLPMWGCYSVVTVIAAVAAGMAFSKAKSKAAKVKMIPEQTVETIKESAAWIQRKA